MQPMPIRQDVVRPVVLIACALAVVLSAADGAAAGRVQWSSRVVEERTSSESWKLKLKLFLPKPPAVAHVPMKFEFTPVTYYERAMLEGDKLVTRKVPLKHRQPIIESVDVGFMDPGSGEVVNRTKFSFKVTRGHGFEAGEYKVKIRHGRTGRTIGRTTRLTFKGENEVVDRRPMVFTGKKKEKGKENEKDESDQRSAMAEQAGTNTFFTEGGELEEDGEPTAGGAGPGSMDTGSDPLPGDEDNPQTIEEKPGGCGCRVQGLGTNAGAGWVAVWALAALGLRRRRGASARS